MIQLLTFTFVKSEEDTQAGQVSEEDNEMDRHALDETIKVVLEEMKIKNSQNINRDIFRKLFKRVLFHDQLEPLPNEEKEIFDKLIEKVVMDAPEEFPASDITKYTDITKITDYLNDLMTEAGIDPSQLGIKFITV
jgi:hypothetical protein